jgi:plastocyanin
MRLKSRTVLASILVALLVATGVGARGHGRAIADTPVVVSSDNDAPAQPPGNPGRGLWGFAPQHIAVTQGDQITFVMSQSNNSSHTVSSLSASGTPLARTLESGTLFDSSPTADQYLKAGATWILDTGPLAPGQYVYYCKIHPWEVGTITVSGVS